MASTLLKDGYTAEYIENLAELVHEQDPFFNRERFITNIFCDNWKKKPLKERMQHIACCLRLSLPDNYRDCIEVLKPVAQAIGGGAQGDLLSMYFPEFVSLFGIKNYKTSIKALEWFTQYSSSEFAIRAFLIQYPEKTLIQMQKWAEHKNYHVRRLASEGCRPRLPWGVALAEFKKDPAPILPILEKLKADDSLYVRRSVANNLNDISKDHPKLVLSLAEQWFQDESNDIRWVVKHGCRTLLKTPEPRALELFGYSGTQHVSLKAWKADKSVAVGDNFSFACRLEANQPVNLGKLRLEYAIHFLRANQSWSKKVFKISEGDVNERHKSVQKSHSFKLLTTRKYYPGKHKLQLLVNGKVFKEAEFDLIN
ncbi:DNA alkylation repair protein [Sessilibacter corallicola]|uniref:DNA alkylation repair protein n=1 Tax=Sessilibacter corallicola TaxID=2904075 RepID=UPI001E50B2A5|nr:DNA alkylation repair protein [Sessilibacter corallicola]MCE2027828.1 DNA alkylation repair protein [Sessilibacter corallicola]